MKFNGFQRAKGHALSFATSPSCWQNGLPAGNGQYGGTFYQPEGSLFEFAFTRLDLWKRRLAGPGRMPLSRFMDILEHQGADALMKALDVEFHDTERPWFKPGGCLNLSLDSNGAFGLEYTLFSQSMRLEPAYGEVSGTTETAAKSVQWTALVTPGDDITAIHVADGYLHPQCVFGFTQRLKLFRKFDEQAHVRRQGVTDDGVLYVEFDFGETLHAIAAALVDGVETRAAKGLEERVGAALDLVLDYTESELAMLKSSLDHQDAVCTKRYEYDIFHTLIVDTDDSQGDLLALARERLLAAKAEGFASMRSRTRHWWRDFWNQSGFALENAALEGLVYSNLYQLAATSIGKVMPGLFGLWNGAATAPWNGDYHGNINVAMYTWPLFGLNHPELLEPLFTTMKGWFPAMRRETKERFGVDELRFPQACGPDGEEMSRGFYRTMRCSTGFYADNYWKRFLYYPDLDELRDEILPVLESGARYYFLYCRQADDGTFHIGPSWAPEQGVFPAWDTGNDLALFKELFQAVVDANRRLGQWSPTAAHAQELLEHFPPYPQKDGEFLISGSEKGRTLLCHPSYLANVVPADEIDADAPLAAVADHTMRTHSEHTMRKGLNGRPGYGCDLTAAWLFTCAVKLRDAEFAQEMLRDVLIANHVKSNGMFAFSQGQVLHSLRAKRHAYEVTDTQSHSLLGQTNSRFGRDHAMTMVQIGGGFLYGIMEAMLQSQKGQLKFFPVPMEYLGRRLSFHRLRAQGGLVVSAGRDARGTAWFTIQNCSPYAWEGTVRLFDRNPPKALRLGRKSIQATAPGVYPLALDAGATVTWRRAAAVQPAEAVPPHRPAVRTYGPGCPIAYGDDTPRL